MKLSSIKTKEDAQTVLKNPRLYDDLLRKNKSFFYKIAQGKLKNYPFDKSEMLHDLMQEGMISFHKAISKYNPEESGTTATLSTFAHTVVTRDLIKFLKKETDKTCFRFMDSEGNEIIKGNLSLEDSLFKRAKNNGGESINEPREELFFSTNSEKYKSVEDTIIPKVYEEQILSRLSKTDIKILELRSQGKSGRQIANEIDMNYHTYKRYLYVVLEKELQKIKEEDNV